MKTSTRKKHLPGITFDPDMPDFSKDPFFVKKAQRARTLIAKVGLPENQPKKRKK